MMLGILAKTENAIIVLWAINRKWFGNVESKELFMVYETLF